MSSLNLRGIYFCAACLGLLGCEHSTSRPAKSAAKSENTSQEVVNPVSQAPNDSFITLNGRVVDTADDMFSLDYGEGLVTVEVDDWDWYPEGRLLLQDDQVVVYGFVDQDRFERRSIEASSIYVKNLGTQFYVSGADEEDTPFLDWTLDSPEVQLVGNVTGVAGDGFLLKTELGVIDVLTAGMLYDPLDDEGYQRIEAGDRVRVNGHLEENFFSDLDLVARTIVELKESNN